MAIKNIIFDFGGVLIDWNPRYLYKDVFKNEDDMEFFLNTICTPEWNAFLDAGLSFEQAVRDLITKYPRYEKEINLYYSDWLKMIGEPIWDNVKLLERLKESYRMFGLTNWSSETFPLVYEKYSFFKLFEGIVVSGEEKCIKPDEQIYKILLQRYKLIESECLFIDDNIENLEAANKLGFQTIHFGEDFCLKTELITKALL